MDSPADLKSLSIEELEQLCEELRQYIIRCCADHPGHIGSSLGAIEIAVALHKVYDTPLDKIVWDVGHQAYAHKIITGRREAFKHNREMGGISGFPKMSESPYDAFGVGHASTSISAALGLAVADEKLGSPAKHIAVIGDGALTGGLAFEGLNNAGGLKADILVIVNDNQISIDQSTGGLHNTLIKITTGKRYNKLKDDVWSALGATRLRRSIQKMVKNAKRVFIKTSELNSYFDSLGFRYFGPIDGNDIENLVTYLTRLRDIKGPKLLHVITTKGAGYKPAEDNPTVWHAPGHYDPETGETIKQDDRTSRYQDVFGKTVTRLAREDSRIVGITPAMLSGSGLSIMNAEMPDRVFDVGIAEGHAVTFSAGLAAGGMLPFCCIYSSFMQRAYDNAIHDVALQKLKVIFCLDRAGLVGEDGATHHGVFDLAAFRPVPNLVIASPRDEQQLCDLLYSATLDEYPATIIRYPRGRGIGTPWENEEFRKVPVGKAELLHEDKDASVAVLSIGPVADKCRQAIEMANAQGIGVIHYDMRFLKPLDKEALGSVCSKVSSIITVEDGCIDGGLHGAVAEYLADSKSGCRLDGLGVPDEFISQGSREQLFDYCGYNTKDIFEAIISFEKK
ncbi:MAG: 1-deoxy-D-xylulose-5-phosphate synthase [Bacteroidales bacterium]|nr:1-deoxy-D-xylulose-5-phosphate synthase [Bacteroidales bacterium]